jgi:transcriptional regulator with XRE-family HTH domain
MQEISSLKFSDQFRKAMQECGLSAAKIAEKSGVSKGYVSGLLAGKKNTPSSEIIKKFSEVLGVNARWLLDGHGTMKPDAQRDATLTAAREFNEALEPAVRVLVKQALRQLDSLLCTAAENGGGMHASMIQHSHECIDAFSCEIKKLRLKSLL